jgi:hypothetical protein
MAGWTKRILTGLGLFGVGAGLMAWYGSARWNCDTTGLVDELTRANRAGGLDTVSFKGFDELPAPVARYFRRVLKEGQPLIRTARVVHTGEFRISEAEDGWSPFESVQHFSVRPPGFVWDARIRMAPLTNVRVRDSYLAGRASMRGKILGLVSMVDEHDTPELKAGAMQRYLAEAVWLPTALLPGVHVRWIEIDDNRAWATLSDSGITVCLEFRFNDAGEITGIYSPSRYRAVGGRYELTPWSGSFRDYEERDGMLIPTAGEVAWQLPAGRLAYWRGRVVAVEYDFAQ